MRREDMDPLGQALLDHLDGKPSGGLFIVREDGLTEEIPASMFFESDPASRIEHAAIGHCTGTILDVGAGAGRHALRLQERGLTVCAVDLSPKAAEVMKRRGVKCVKCCNIFDLKCRQFDTMLMLSHGLGLVETVEGLEKFLDHARGLLTPGGQILAESLNVGLTSNREHLDYQAQLVGAGRHRGEMRFVLEYDGKQSSEFGWLHIAFGELKKVAAKKGWSAERLMQETGGDYLCRLTTTTT